MKKFAIVTSICDNLNVLDGHSVYNYTLDGNDLIITSIHEHEILGLYNALIYKTSMFLFSLVYVNCRLGILCSIK